MPKAPFYLDLGFHFVCLSCRRSMKRATPYVWDKTAVRHQPKMKMEKVICPECRGEMLYMGEKFTPPPRKDLRQWKKLEWLLQSGWSGYSWPTTAKMNLRDAQDSLAAASRAKLKRSRKTKENDAFLERRRAAKTSFSRLKTAKKRFKADLKRQEEYQIRVLEEARGKATMT